MKMSNNLQNIYNNTTGSGVSFTTTALLQPLQIKSSTSNDSISFGIPDDCLYVNWNPKSDISVYELAKATPFINSNNVKGPIDLNEFIKLSDDVVRHFDIINDGSESYERYIKIKTINDVIEKL